MKIVIDSNIIMSALIKDSITRKIIVESNNSFFHPKIALRNLEKYKSELIEKSNINEYELNEVLKDLLGKISLIEDEEFLVKLDEAKEIMGTIDIEDIPFIAAALAINADGIWSFNKHFLQQDKIKVITTEELINIDNE